MMKRNSQKGAAAIWYVFVMGIMMSFGALGIEGARYITKKARLGDGLEAAAIAVSTADRVNQDFSLNRVKPVAENWVKHYVNDSTKLELDIKRKEDKKIQNYNPLSPYEVAYYRYDVTARTEHKSWFNFNSWASFDPDVVVVNTGTSGRIKGGHEPVDLVFVADFSGSMTNNSNGKNKLDSLQTAIKEVSTAIYKANDQSTFGFIPFTKRIINKRSDGYYCSSPLLSSKNSDFDKIKSNKEFYQLLSIYSFDERYQWYVNHGFKTTRQQAIGEYYVALSKAQEKTNYQRQNQSYRDYREIIGKCIYGHRCNKSVRNKLDEVNNKDHIKNYNGYELDISINNVDLERTAKRSFDVLMKEPIFSTAFKYGEQYDRDEMPLFGSYCAYWDRDGLPSYYTLKRTNFLNESDLKAFNRKVKKMTAGGGTDMYQGLLAAPHEFYAAENKNRYIIVLSDGEENNNTFSQLVGKGLCKTINDKLKENGKYSFKMFVVGIGFNPSGTAYNTCFGKENIIPVYDMGMLTDKILGLITDDIGHNFDRYNKDSNVTPVGRHH
ncbi:hypothetical protein [Photobacterium sanguinicancri]|uniref:pilus assembly protein n=1 Tax=Photobacterium sanguinicancri TaxID=875932 RepID=UPI003D0973BF